MGNSLRQCDALAFGAHSVDVNGVKTVCAEERSGQGSPLAGATMNEEPSAFWQIAHAGFEPGAGKGLRSIQMPLLELGSCSHVDDLALGQCLGGIERGEVDPWNRGHEQPRSLRLCDRDP